MIIFDLDGTLANCEHRRHFVEPKYFIDKNDLSINSSLEDVLKRNDDIKNWKPNWKAFYEACNGDTPIIPTIEIFHTLQAQEKKVQIWSGRCESVRDKTHKWLVDNLSIHFCTRFCEIEDLKMRPIGDYTPDDQLKERWLNEALARGEKIEFVFDDRPKVVRMWRRRGIFVFDCNQSGREF